MACQSSLCSMLLLTLLCHVSALVSNEAYELPTAAESFSTLSATWSAYWGSHYKFLDVTGQGATLEDVLSSCEYNSVVVAFLGATKPLRRNSSSGEAFLQIINEPQSNALSPHSQSLEAHNHSDALLSQQVSLDDLLGVSVVNQGIQAVEAILGRSLYGFRLYVMPFPEGAPGCRKPYAVWEVSSGNLYIDQWILTGIAEHSEQVRMGTNAIAQTLTAQLGNFIASSYAEISQGDLWTRLVHRVVPGVLLIALGSQVPLWFCIACPVVLGLLAPFVFNAGFGAAAEAICTHYSLPADECNDLWYGAFAAAMILSFASAIPIVYICQVPKCSVRGKAL